MQAKARINEYVRRAKSIIEQKENPSAPAGAETASYVIEQPEDVHLFKFAVLRGDGTKCFNLISADRLESIEEFETNKND